MKYKCIKEFAVNRYDEDGARIDDSMKIEEGSVWESSEKPDRIIGGEVFLINREKQQWLEIPKDRLEESFESVE